jgi:hypothetical protein
MQASERVRGGKVCAVMRQPSITSDGVSQRFPFASAVPIASFATILTFVPDDAGGEASAEGYRMRAHDERQVDVSRARGRDSAGQ